MRSEQARAYERGQGERLRAVCLRLRALGGLIEAAEAGRAPVLAFTCPVGHRFHPVRLAVYEAEYPTGLVLDHLPGALPKRPAIRNGSPLGRSTRSVCEALGCPSLVDEPGTCTAHGGRRVERDGALSDAFCCRRCGWRDTITAARQLELYGAAVLRGYGEVCVSTGRPTRRR